MPGEARIPTAALVRSIWLLAVYVLVVAALIFLPAGDLRWGRGWLFLVVFILLTIPSLIYLQRTNPEIFVARSRIQKGTEGWDLVLVAILVSSMLAEFPLAAADAGRFHWSRVAPWTMAVGYVLLAFGYVVSVWAYGVNQFAEPGVRVQSERGQRVVDRGPYAIVRHPVYLGGLCIAASVPLALGSLWALLPGAVASVAILVRIPLEERTLRAGLPGYVEYAARVRSRQFPGIW